MAKWFRYAYCCIAKWLREAMINFYCSAFGSLLHC